MKYICKFNDKQLYIDNISGTCVSTLWKCLWGNLEFYMISKKDEGVSRVNGRVRNEQFAYVPNDVIKRTIKAIENKEYIKR